MMSDLAQRMDKMEQRLCSKFEESLDLLHSRVRKLEDTLEHRQLVGPIFPPQADLDMRIDCLEHLLFRTPISDFVKIDAAVDAMRVPQS